LEFFTFIRSCNPMLKENFIFRPLIPGFIAVIFYSCSGDKKDPSVPANKDSEPAKVQPVYKKQESDTLIVTSRSAIFYSPDSIQIEKRKKEIGEHEFYIGADDYAYYSNESWNYLEKMKLPLVMAINKNYLKFISPGKTTLIRIDTLPELWGVYLFDPKKHPYQADIMDMEEEYKNYFNN
jgi:hypothetical protein